METEETISGRLASDVRAVASPGRDARPPGQIGRFRVERVIGAGGMGVVYLARDELLERPLAIKLVRPTRDGWRRRQRRLLREAQALARVTHPNVVAIHEAGIVDDAVYIAMEYVEGVTLAEASRRAGGWRAILDLYVQAGRGLQAAHELGIVHRDFKPANALVGVDGRVRVADFGLASDVGREEVARTHRVALEDSETTTDALVGTPAYMAPEVLLGAPADARSDQYSLCVSLYEALHGARPRSGRTLVERDDVRPTLGSRRRGVPRFIDAAIARGLRARDDRWPSIDALLQGLSLERRARRRGAVGLLATTLVALPAALILRPWAGPAPCQVAPGELEIAAAYNLERRAAVRDALAGSEVPGAARASELVVARLDAYRDAWAAGWRDACEAAQLRRDQSPALMDARMRCLGERTRAARALVDVLADATVIDAEQALVAVAALPAIDRCADVEHVVSQAPEPADEETARVVATLRDRHAELQALRRAGQFKRAHEQLAALSVDAAATEHAPIIAEVALLEGRLLDDLGRYEEAAAALERAYLDAERSGAFAVARDAAIALVHVSGYQRQDFDAGERWSRLAAAKGEYTHDPRARVSLEINRGELLEARGDLDGALAAYQQALTWHNEQADADVFRTAEIHGSIGTVLTTAARHDEARSQLERALALLEAHVGPEHAYLAAALNNLANNALLTDHANEAIPLYERALALWSRTKGERSPALTPVLNNLGVAYRESGDFASARRSHERALAIREASFGPESPQVASVLNNLGSLALTEEDYETARRHFQRVVSIRERALGPEHVEVGTALKGQGLALYHLGALDEARALVQRALPLHERALGAEHRRVAYVYMDLAEIELAAGAPRIAAEHLARARATVDAEPPTRGSHCWWRFLHARVLWDTNEDRAQARSLAEQAGEECARTDATNWPRRHAIARWLAAHAT